MFISPNLRRLFVLFGDTVPVIVRYDDPVNSSFASNAPPPSVAIGQPNTTQITFTTASRSSIGISPSSIWVDTLGTLWVSDSQSNRILWWDSAETATTSGLNATGVLGQTSFLAIGGGITQSTFKAPTGIFREERAGVDILWVADSENNRFSFLFLFSLPPQLIVVLMVLYIRVLGFDFLVTPKATGMNATYVLGQKDFFSASAGSSSSLFATPEAVFGDGKGGLFVADPGNHRVVSNL